MTKPDKPLTLAHLLRTKNGLLGAILKLTGETTPEERVAFRRAVWAQSRRTAKRPRGSKNTHTRAVQQYVENLVREHPQATHETLYQLAVGEKPVGTMARDTFRGYVRAARAQLGIKGRPGPRR